MIFRLTYDGHLVPLSNVKDLPEVGRGEDRAARVGGRVDDASGSVVVDERLHVAEVDHPVVVGEKVVLPGLNSQPGREGGVEGKARTGHQNVLTVVSKSRDGNVQGTRATRAQDHIVRGHLMQKKNQKRKWNPKPTSPPGTLTCFATAVRASTDPVLGPFLGQGFVLSN